MTIAQQLKIKDFPFIIKNKDGKEIYHENSNGTWRKREYNANGNRILYENSNGNWSKYEYDADGNEIHYKDSDGYWSKYEYDVNGKQIYYEDSKGNIIDNRPKTVEVTLEEIAKKLGIKVEQLRIKD